MTEWFETWFGTAHYHRLYGNRNVSEAQMFLNNLITCLHPLKQDRILDLACGTGRHCMYLSSLGFQVTGADLSEDNIAEARKRCNKTTFLVHDMRNPLAYDRFDIILNLFTSFGYFRSEDDNLRAVTSMYKSLKPGGRVVIAYMNSVKEKDKLPSIEHKSLDGYDYKISKALKDGRFCKTIEVMEDGTAQIFHEQVEALDLNDFLNLFQKAGFEVSSTFGDYNLKPFNTSSERLIILATRI